MRPRRGTDESERDRQFHDFVAARRGQLVHTARLLAAGDAYLAEDLVQTTLTKLYVSWSSFRRAGNPDGYVRRTLINALIDERKRVWRRFERSVPELPDRAAADAATADPELVRALRRLPPRMRAAVVFRFFHELDVAETAEALGVSAGTVKSQTSRALEKLRTALQQDLQGVK